MVADDRYFRRGAVFHDVEQRDDAGGREIQVAYVAAGLVDRPSQRHRDEFQIGQQARVVLYGQGRENMVLLRGMRRSHRLRVLTAWARYRQGQSRNAPEQGASPYLILCQMCDNAQNKRMQPRKIQFPPPPSVTPPCLLFGGFQPPVMLISGG